MRRGTASGVLVAVLAMAVAAAACRGNADEAERVPIEDRPPAGPEPDDESSADTRSAAARSFALGVEYTEVGLAWPYAEVGVEWAKTRLEAFTWGAIEPEAPEGTTHSYDWSCADALVRDWQQAGVVHLQSYLSPEADWAVDPDRHPAPRTEHLDDYRAFVTAIVERYDGDGTDDMPGLVAPVRHWVIGGEWTGFWRSDDADAYLEVLAATREAAQRGE